jgi:hypothetical protein
MFRGAKPYLLVHIVAGIILMLFIIDPKSPWTTPERWIGSLLLWHMIINWAGIMESRPWLFFSEIFRLVITTSFLIHLSADSVFSPLNLLWMIFSLISMAWTTRYFRIYLPLNLNQQP